MTYVSEARAKKNHRTKAVVFRLAERVGSDLDDPARRAFDVAGLNAGQLFVQALGHGTDVGFAVEHVQFVFVADAADRG
jgi:hypothetical protein